MSDEQKPYPRFKGSHLASHLWGLRQLLDVSHHADGRRHHQAQLPLPALRHQKPG